MDDSSRVASYVYIISRSRPYSFVRGPAIFAYAVGLSPLNISFPFCVVSGP